MPDILECELKWALESITMNKASGGDGIPVELFQILKDDAVNGRYKQNLVHTRTQEKGAVTPQETDPHLPGSAQESPAKVWLGGGLLQGWGH